MPTIVHVCVLAFVCPLLFLPACNDSDPPRQFQLLNLERNNYSASYGRLTSYAGNASSGAIVGGAADAVEFTRQFEQVYGGPGHDSAGSLIQTSDGGYFLLEATRNATDNDLIIRKTDRNGYTEWQKTITYASGINEQYYTRDNVKQTSDGGYVIGAEIRPGIHAPQGGDLGDIWLIRLNAAGEKLWDVVVGTAIIEAGGAVEITPDGGFVLSGATAPNAGGLPSPFFAKVDANGNLLWMRSYPAFLGPGIAGNIFDIDLSHDDGFILTGGPNSFLMKTDRDGNLLQVTAPVRGRWAYRVTRTPDGGYMTAGSNNDLQLIKYDGNLRVEWTRTFGGSGVDFAQGLELAPDGYVATGWVTVNGIEQIYVVHVDRNGNLINEGFFGPGEGTSIRPTMDGGYIVSGLAVSPPLIGLGGRDSYLLKLKELEKPGYITGALFGDMNLSCSIDPNEGLIGHRLISAMDEDSNVYLVPVGQSGRYSAAVPPGNYKVTVVHDEKTEESCSPDRNYTAAITQGETAGNYDFSLQAECCGNIQLSGRQSTNGAYSCNPPNVQITPCAGYNWTYCATITNCSSLDWPSGNGRPAGVGNNTTTLCFNFAPGMSPISYSSTCTGWRQVNPSSPCFQIGPNAFTGGTSCQICANVSVSNTSVAPWATSASLVPYCQGSSAPAATSTIVDNSQCSCDPNDMQVAPKGCGSGGSISGIDQELTYTIRFQNVGAGPAHNIHIRNLLDDDLDPSSLRILSSTHAITGMQIDPDNELVLTFNGIELPADVQDPVGSNGSVTYSILPRHPFSDGAIVDNGAAIFFDSNPGVMTNRVRNTLYQSDTVPVTEFVATRQSDGFDFLYTGGSSDIKYHWNFGDNASPSTSTVPHPTSVIFNGSGPHPVTLTVTKNECASAKTHDVAPCRAWGPCATDSTCLPSPATLVAWYPGDVDGRDVIAGNDLMPSGVSNVPAQVNNGFGFDSALGGGTPSMQAADASALNFDAQTSFTFDFWLRFTGVPQTCNGNPTRRYHTLIEKRAHMPNGAVLGYSVFLNCGKPGFQLAPGGANFRNYFADGPDLRDGNFHHLAIVVDRVSLTGSHIYVDGVAVPVSGRVGFNATGIGSLVNDRPMMIGAPIRNTDASPWPGLLDEISIYHHALSAAEIGTIYEARTNGKCLP